VQVFKTTILIASLTALTGCATWDKSPICLKTHGWEAWNDARCNVENAPKGMADSLAATDGMAAEMAASKQRVAELERQLASRDKELADLRGSLVAEEQKLKAAQRGLIRALRPQIEKGDITVDLNNERLLINLSSSYLFGSGQDELTPAGADALRQVGAVLKDFPEYKVEVDGHTDNVPIGGELKNKFPTNQELSESRAVNAAKALRKGGMDAVTTTGYADTQPVEPNTTPAGRAKNRRIEVRVTK
jgi:chemotaxis protein MotB